MTPLFADTSFYLALLSADDAHHGAAVNLSRQLRRPVVTTEFIVLELGDALCRTDGRAMFISLVEEFRSDPTLTIVPCSSELLQRGIELYRARPDKQWSLTDCISFAVMTEYGLNEALTADHHFQQAGFTVLLP